MNKKAIITPVVVIAVIVMAIAIKPDLAVVLAVALPVMLLCILLFMKLGFPRFTAMQARVDGLNANVQESITNIPPVFIRAASTPCPSLPRSTSSF